MFVSVLLCYSIKNKGGKHMIYTVNGPIKKDELGMTLSHEHFKWEFDEDYASKMYFDREYDDKDIEKTYNLVMPIMKSLKELGCEAVVETSPPIGGQNLKLLKRLSDESKVKIIPSTGWNMSRYVHRILSENHTGQLAKQWISDIKDGLDTIDGVKIQPGYIKLLLWRGEFNQLDQDMLRAAVIASKETGIPIHCHILEAKMMYEVVDLLDAEGMDYSKFLWAHACIAGDYDAIAFAIEKGMWVGFDNVQPKEFETYYNLIQHAIDLKATDKILLSQDYDFYGEAKAGTPENCYSLFEKFIPYCVNKGMSEDLLKEILTKNPCEYYDY